jgi:hypothetical protein
MGWREMYEFSVFLIGGRSSQSDQGATAMTIKTDDETLVVRSDIKAGRITANHNETLVVRSSVKAGGREINHNESFRR